MVGLSSSAGAHRRGATHQPHVARLRRALAVGMGAAIGLLPFASEAHATWKLELGHTPSSEEAPWSDLRSIATFQPAGGGPTGFVASFNNGTVAGVSSAVVLYARSSGGDPTPTIIAEHRYNPEKAKAVAADRRGFIYVGLPGAIDVLALEQEEPGEGEDTGAFALVPRTRIALGDLFETTAGNVEGVAVRESFGGQVTVFASERGLGGRVFAVDVTALADDGEPAVALDFGPEGSGFFVPPSTVGLDASMRGLHVDGAGRVWVCAFATNQAIVLNATGTAEVAVIANLFRALDVVTDDQFAYVTSFNGPGSRLFQVRLADVDAGIDPAVEVLLDPFSSPLVGTGGASGIDLEPGPIAGQATMLIGIEEVLGELRPTFGGRDLVIRNGLPVPDPVAFGAAGTTLEVLWEFSDLDPEDAQQAYRVRVFEGLGATGAILFEAVVDGEGVEVTVPLVTGGPFPQSVSIALFDPVIEGNATVFNVPSDVATALLDALRKVSVSGGGCAVAAGPGASPVDGVPGILALLAAVIGVVVLGRRGASHRASEGVRPGSACSTSR